MRAGLVVIDSSAITELTVDTLEITDNHLFKYVYPTDDATWLPDPFFFHLDHENFAFSAASDLTLSDWTLEGNTCENCGGLLYIEAPSVGATLSSLTIDGHSLSNDLTESLLLLDLSAGDFTLSASEFTDNSLDGAALKVEDGSDNDLELASVKFNQNTGATNAGALDLGDNINLAVTLTSCTFTENEGPTVNDIYYFRLKSFSCSEGTFTQAASNSGDGPYEARVLWHPPSDLSSMSTLTTIAFKQSEFDCVKTGTTYTVSEESDWGSSVYRASLLKF
jgi:hypothetical protein